MKHIVKGTEPARFTQWKHMINEDWQPDWDDCPSDIKGAVLEALIREQGSICCYCSMAIDGGHSHVEHLKPRKWERNPATFSDLQFAYENLLASCGRRDIAGEPRHCGKAKENWYDEHRFVSPLDPTCERRFLYAADGGIFPAARDDIAAETTIPRLALGIDKLRAMRKGALDGALDGIENMTSAEIRAEIERYRTRDPDGSFAPFCVAIVQVLSALV
ncbi:MAG: retron system putative HNH endonuclease [Thermodesulfobacteriota bacterium]